MYNLFISNCFFKVETRLQTRAGFSIGLYFVFLFPFSIRSPSKPVCVSLAGSLLQTGSWGDTASRKHPTGAFSFANLSEHASVRSRRRRTVGIQASGREREFCTRLCASPIVGAEWLAQKSFKIQNAAQSAAPNLYCHAAQGKGHPARHIIRTKSYIIGRLRPRLCCAEAQHAALARMGAVFRLRGKIRDYRKRQKEGDRFG